MPQSAKPTRRLKILLVEDHADTLETVTLLLRRSGHEVFPTACCAEARTAGRISNVSRLFTATSSTLLLSNAQRAESREFSIWLDLSREIAADPPNFSTLTSAAQRTSATPRFGTGRLASL